MGTTASVLVLVPRRARRPRGRQPRSTGSAAAAAQEYTFDHSLVWETTASGQYNPNLPNLVPKNIITRSLGPHQDVAGRFEGPYPLE